MAQMSNAQAALQAAATRWSGIHGPASMMVETMMDEADKYLVWLDEKDDDREVPGVQDDAAVDPR